MANSYVIQSMIGLAGGNTTLVGTVNGVSVTISFATQVFASAAAFETFVQPLMLAAFNATATAFTPPTTSFSV